MPSLIKFRAEQKRSNGLNGFKRIANLLETTNDQVGHRLAQFRKWLPSYMKSYSKTDDMTSVKPDCMGHGNQCCPVNSGWKSSIFARPSPWWFTKLKGHFHGKNLQYWYSKCVRVVINNETEEVVCYKIARNILNNNYLHS